MRKLSALALVLDVAGVVAAIVLIARVPEPRGHDDHFAVALASYAAMQQAGWAIAACSAAAVVIAIVAARRGERIWLAFTVSALLLAIGAAIALAA
ncbi:MAG TPA: hypothetical protein VF824_14165 [Thermoanaerobaculia bacterium]|jgi:hypothetical protein